MRGRVWRDHRGVRAFPVIIFAVRSLPYRYRALNGHPTTHCCNAPSPSRMCSANTNARLVLRMRLISASGEQKAKDRCALPTICGSAPRAKHPARATTPPHPPVRPVPAQIIFAPAWLRPHPVFTPRVPRASSPHTRIPALPLECPPPSNENAQSRMPLAAASPTLRHCTRCSLAASPLHPPFLPRRVLRGRTPVHPAPPSLNVAAADDYVGSSALNLDRPGALSGSTGVDGVGVALWLRRRRVACTLACARGCRYTPSTYCISACWMVAIHTAPCVGA
ncbi:hypothetical protein DFH09DRAFT_1318127 [Mycena vulgaris]|nr:hypothetical protein DFH09DRAFT_1318127 [Mycena vulgaris]